MSDGGKSSNCGIIFRRIEPVDQPAPADLFGGHVHTSHFTGDQHDPKRRVFRDIPPRRNIFSSDSIFDDDVSPGPEEEASQDEERDEISEYKRVRLLDRARTHWILLACARYLIRTYQNFRFDFAYHGPPVSQDALLKLVSYSRRDMLPLKEGMTPTGLEAYFEIRAVGGDPCLGFYADVGSIKSLGGCEGFYTYDCSDGRLFASSATGILGAAGGLSLTSGDLVGFGISRSHGYVFINDELIREFGPLGKISYYRLLSCF